MEMAKRLMALMGMLAMMLAAAAPAALAQDEAAQYGGEEVAATGVLTEGFPADVGGIGTHSISDDATGELYVLRSAGADLDSYVNQQVTVYGALTPGEEGSGEAGFEGNGTLPSIDVTRVEPAGVVGEEVVVTGVIGPFEEVFLIDTSTTECAGQPCPPYGTMDELTGRGYGFFGDEDSLGAYVGQEATVTGTVRLEGFQGGPTLVDVTSVEPAQPLIDEVTPCDEFLPGGEPNPGYDPGDPSCPAIEPPPVEVGEPATLTFELTVEGEPPANATFFGFVGFEDGPGEYVPLDDPDGDGLYAGSTTLEDRFRPGPRPVPPGTEPKAYAVRIVRGTGTSPESSNFPGDPISAIKDFGVVLIEAENTFSAGVSFGGEPPEPPTEEEGSATGVVERLGEEDSFCGVSTHFIVDEESGRQVDLISDIVDLDAYVGQRVAAYGEILASPAVVGAERCPDLDVTQIEPIAIDPVDPVYPVDPVDPAPGVDVDGDGFVDASDGEEAARISDSAADASGGARVLPNTGGATLVLLGAGALLVVAALLVRRATG